MQTNSVLSARTFPTRSTLRHTIEHVRDVLAARVLESINDDGAIVGTCEGRVLESAIALCVLQRLDLCPTTRERLVKFLHKMWDEGPSDPFHRALIASVLGRDTSGDLAASADGYLKDFEHFTSSRKRVLFHIILAAVSGRRVELELKSDDFVAGPEHQQWVAALMRALEVLYFCSRGELERITEDAFAPLLISACPVPNGVWQQYVFGHVLALLALSEHPRYRAVARRYAESLPSLQCANGGVPFITRMEIFATATAGVGLVGAGIEPRALYRAGDFVARHQQANGGWGYADGVDQPDVDDTTYCMEFLSALDPRRYAQPLSRGVQYLIAIQNDDGGFPTFARGGSSEVAMTAAALNALAPHRHQHTQAFRQGLDYIFANQRFDGTYERSWSGAHTNAIYRAVRAIQSASEAPALAKRTTAQLRAMTYVHLAQNADGGWGHIIGDASDLLSSAYALIALSYQNTDHAYLRGIEYILSQQHSDGGFRSRPDGLGPRPVVYDIPGLADHFALLALDHIVSTY